MKKNCAIKIIGLSVLALIILWFVKAVLFPTGFGLGINIRTNYGGGSMYMGTGLGLGVSLTLLLTYFIKFLFVVFTIGLVATLVVAVKKYILTAEDIETYKNVFKCKKAKENKTTCKECGKEVSEDWKLCPYCTTAIEKQV